MKFCGGVGQSVVEVYWNGELIDIIDFVIIGFGWQIYNFNIVGGFGDGSNMLIFVEIGFDNNGGVLIDSVLIVFDSCMVVVEEYLGVEIVLMFVIDLDVGDMYIFMVFDECFEVVVFGDKYMLSFKDDEVFDYESEIQVMFQVMVIDQGGLFDMEMVVIDVIDIEDVNVFVGVLMDMDNMFNSVNENGVGGEYVGVVVEVVDLDGEIVIYIMDDFWFDIDLVIGELSVKDGVSFDYEVMFFVDVEIMVNLVDGFSLIGIFMVIVNDVNEVLDQGFEFEFVLGVLVILMFVDEVVDFSNMLGVFYMDGNGNLVVGEIVWVDVNLFMFGIMEIVYLEGVEVVGVGYFLIFDGGLFNVGLVNGEFVIFQRDGIGNWQVVFSNGILIVGVEVNIYFFGDGLLNVDGVIYVQMLGVIVFFEDWIDGGDQDFNDLVFEQIIFEILVGVVIYEEEVGVVVGQFSVVDFDVGDMVIFVVFDEWFEVVEIGGSYVLKLKDDMVVDYENE